MNYYDVDLEFESLRLLENGITSLFYGFHGPKAHRREVARTLRKELLKFLNDSSEKQLLRALERRCTLEEEREKLLKDSITTEQRCDNEVIRAKNENNIIREKLFSIENELKKLEITHNIRQPTMRYRFSDLQKLKYQFTLIKSKIFEVKKELTQIDSYARKVFHNITSEIRRIKSMSKRIINNNRVRIQRSVDREVSNDLNLVSDEINREKQATFQNTKRFHNLMNTLRNELSFPQYLTDIDNVEDNLKNIRKEYRGRIKLISDREIEEVRNRIKKQIPELNLAKDTTIIESIKKHIIDQITALEAEYALVLQRHAKREQKLRSKLAEIVLDLRDMKGSIRDDSAAMFRELDYMHSQLSSQQSELDLKMQQLARSIRKE